MSDEKEFHTALMRAGFLGIQTKKKILPNLMSGEQNLETDNLCHKGNTLYLFEGKKFYIVDAESQLKIRFISAMINRTELVRKRHVFPYNRVRLFAYSLFRGILNEYNDKGIKLQSKRFRNLNELIEILNKL